MYRVINATKETAELYLYGDIGGYFDGITARQVLGDVSEITADRIQVRINSYGGDAFEGFAIYSTLRAHGAHIETYVDGVAASTASVIAMAGHEVTMAELSMLMIHNPWTMAMGEAEELRARADLLDKTRAKIVQAYGRTKQSREQLQDWMAAETWFTGDEAVEAGFADSVDGQRPAVAASANPRLLAQLKLPRGVRPATDPQQVAAARARLQLAEID